MGNLGPAELIIILVIILIIFGAGKLPEIGSALGKGIREFRAATREVDEAKKELKDVAREAEQAAPSDKPQTS